MTDLGLFWINPLEVEACLKKAEFQYPFRTEADFYRGWSQFPVIPGCYELTRKLGHFPTPNEGLSFLMRHCDSRYKDDPKVVRRAHKLYMDFSRDIHTLALLQQCPLLGSVWYQKALDLAMNVDYLATLLSTLSSQREQIGIQAAMRGKNYDWETGPLERLKEARRQRRGEEGWQGPIYWLTNRHRPAYKAINRCWLFGPGHIYDLAEEIRVNDVPQTIAIQTEMQF